jgi:sugar phosphate isomerase/epimerase
LKISYLCYEPTPRLDELDRRMALAAGLGYRGIELSATHPLGFEPGDLIALTRKHRLPVVSLLSGWSYANEGLCLSVPDPATRGRAVARLVEYVRLAETLGALLVVGLMQGLKSDEPDEATALGRIAEGLRGVADAAESSGVDVVIEPVNHQQVGFNNSVAEARAMATRVGSPRLGTMLDTFHMNIEEPSVLGSIAEHAPHARHVHLCETNGGLLGTGHIDVPAVLAALEAGGYDRFVSVKVYRHADWDEAARRSAEYLRGCGVEMAGGA